MQKRKTKNRKNLLILVGFFFVLIGILIFSISVIKDKLADFKDKKLLENFYNTQQKIEEESSHEHKAESKEVIEAKSVSKKKQEYIAILKIPKIDLERGLVDKNSQYNDLKVNIKILDESALPEKEKGNVILASHTGTVRGAFFRRLDELEVNDIASIVYNGKEYVYKVANKYDIPKTGKAEIIRDKEKNTLTLISCKFKTKYQIIIICELVEII